VRHLNLKCARPNFLTVLKTIRNCAFVAAVAGKICALTTPIVLQIIIHIINYNKRKWVIVEEGNI
jgi:hypothetical protein